MSAPLLEPQPAFDATRVMERVESPRPEWLARVRPMGALSVRFYRVQLPSILPRDVRRIALAIQDGPPMTVLVRRARASSPGDVLFRGDVEGDSSGHLTLRVLGARVRGGGVVRGRAVRALDVAPGVVAILDLGPTQPSPGLGSSELPASGSANGGNP